MFSPKFLPEQASGWYLWDRSNLLPQAGACVRVCARKTIEYYPLLIFSLNQKSTFDECD